MNALTIQIPDANGAVQIVSTMDALLADGGQVTIGAKADAAVANAASTASLMAFLKGLVQTNGANTDAAAVQTDTTAVSHTSLLKEISKQVQLFAAGHGVAAGAVRVELPTDGTGLSGAQISDGLTPANKATVAQFHNADNQQPGGTAFGLLTGGLAQLLNAAFNIDRQRATGADSTPGRGIATGAMQFAQEFLTTTTTTVAAAAATATLAIVNTSGFQVGGTVNFEPSLSGALPVRYESATITAVVANTSVTVSFPAGGALFTHTQPYLVQTFMYNQERDFSGEGPTAQGIGAAIAAEYESNSGGPPLSTGLPTLWTLEADRNIQGKNNQQMAITATGAGNTSLVFSANPWINGLLVGQAVILSVGANGAAVEVVIVSKNNNPAVGAGPVTVNLVNPVINANSTFATFDAYGLNVPSVATAQGTEDTLIWLFDPAATDPKRALAAHAKAPGLSGAGGALVSADQTKPTYRYFSAGNVPAATPTDVFTLAGSATRTIRIKKIVLSGLATTAGQFVWSLIRRSAANTGGTSTAPVPLKHDVTNDPTATAVLALYTANPTALGTTVGTVRGGRLFHNLSTAQNDRLVFDFSLNQDKALILRGTADIIAINGGGAALPAGATLDIELEYEEDQS